MLHAVIMAGGSGTRFWPASRRTLPKQLLALAGDTPLLRATYERVAPLLPAQQIWVVTTAATAELARRLLPELAADHVVAEPVGRDTAACTGLAARLLIAEDPEAVCLVLPADHLVGDEDRFRQAMRTGARLVGDEGGLLTFGIRPTRPETGYGYLKLGPAERTVDGWDVHHLERFVEKPDQATARAYVASEDHLWNSGMFAWRAADLLAEIERQLPLLAAGLERIASALGSAEADSVLAREYPNLPRISVDFGIMENASRCWTMPVDFPWSDVGSWSALAAVLPRDGDGNALRGRTVRVAASDNILVSQGPAIAVAGVHGLVVVATDDAVLVVPTSEAQQVRDIVADVEAQGWDDLL
jgi:mannose-1-phosphate guanylyltransferase